MAFDSVKYSTQKAPLRDDRIQPILVWKYLGTTLWGFNQWNMAKGSQTFEHDLLNMICLGIEKMEFFTCDCLSFYRSPSNSLICLLFVSQL